ncbi:hypothetical protein QO7_2263 [Clostridioides difficile F314]|nr:hypothetical protein QO7_2263 [Clostridioides difficile F314]
MVTVSKHTHISFFLMHPHICKCICCLVFDFLLSVIFCFCYLVFLMLTSFKLLSKYERALYIRLNQIITRTRFFCIKFVLIYDFFKILFLDKHMVAVHDDTLSFVFIGNLTQFIFANTEIN